MTRIERFQGLLMAAAALLGLALGASTDLGRLGEHLVLPALLVMLTAVFFQLDLAQVGEVRRARALVAASLVLNYLVTPALAWALGAGLLGDQPDLRIGLLLLLVTPCTDWYLVFTAMARGHTGLAVALLPVNLVLQVLLLPVYILLLGGDAAAGSTSSLVAAVLMVLVLPLSVGCGLRVVVDRCCGIAWRQRHLDAWASRLQIPLLCLAVVAMFAGQAEALLTSGAELLLLLPPLAIWFTLLPLLATGAAVVLRLPGSHRVTLTMVTVARNSPLALAVAVGAFPDRPLIAVALIIGPLIELPLLAVLARIVRERDPR
ncbi:arsenic resistance protein [Nesterenkonia suensis]